MISILCTMYIRRFSELCLLFAGTACSTLSTPTSARAPQKPARRRSCSWCPGVRTLPRSKRRCSTPPPLMPWKSASWESRSSFRSVFTTHCKDTIPKMRKKYSQKRSCAATVPIPTFMCLWAIDIFPQSICLFCCKKICGQILGIYKSLTDTWMWKLGLRPQNFQKRNT